VARPLGGVFFGNYGDRAGRRKALIATLMLMGGATFLLEATGSTLPIVLYVVAALAITIGAVLVSRETAEDELERTAKPEEREIVERPEAIEPSLR
jgi:MFS family permease